jgi:putative transposase
MGRPLRTVSGDIVYHVLNRANARMTLFEDAGDYRAFERVLTEACARVSIRLLAYCVMPNHWHLVVWPRQDGDLSRFMSWLTLTHTQRWRQHRHSVGEGHVYQGRFKSFPVETSDYLLAVCRYVERNPVRAGLVERAEQWPWSSAAHWGEPQQTVPLSAWPLEWPPDWQRLVNTGEVQGQIEALRRSVTKGQPFGSPLWVERMVTQWHLGVTMRGRGRPRKDRKRNNGS